MNTISKKIIFTCIAMSFSWLGFAQKDFQGKAYYMSKTTMDMSRFGNQMSEERKKQIADRMKSMLEKSYVLTFNTAESVYKEEEKLDAPGQGGGRGFGRMFSGASGPQYKNVKDNSYLQENELFGKQFLVKDKLKAHEWKMESETKQIGKYTAYKATTMIDPDAFDPSNFSRRGPRGGDAAGGEESKPEEPKKILVTAWYTPQIPVNQGPGEFWGLPGLILEVHQGNTTVLCAKIVMNADDKEKIKVPSKGKKVSQSEYTDIATKKMEEIREQFRNRGSRGGGGGRGR